jgi:hypothetical protein
VEGGASCWVRIWDGATWLTNQGDEIGAGLVCQFCQSGEAIVSLLVNDFVTCRDSKSDRPKAGTHACQDCRHFALLDFKWYE